MTAKILPVLFSLALAMTACGGADSASEDTASRPGPDATAPLDPPDEAGVLLEVRDVGGFVPVDYELTRMPGYVVMSNGTIYSQGPVTMEYPGKVLPNLRATEVGADGLARLRAIVDEMDLAAITEERNRDGMKVIADASETVVTYFDEEGAHIYGVYALGLADSADDPRAGLLEELVDTLATLVAEGTDLGAYEPDRVEMFATPEQAAVDPEFANVAPWPADVSFDEMAAGPIDHRCAVLEGAAAAGFMAAMADANQATTFEVDRTEYRVLARPLFPHEMPACGGEGQDG